MKINTGKIILDHTSKGVNVYYRTPSDKMEKLSEDVRDIVLHGDMSCYFNQNNNTVLTPLLNRVFYINFIERNNRVVIDVV